MSETRAGRFLRLPLADKLTLACALFLLMIAAILLRLLPFAWVMRLAGQSLGAVGYAPPISIKQTVRARLIQRSLERASRFAPFRADCLPQAIAGTLLSRCFGVPTALHLGVRFDAQHTMEAHAWLVSGAVAVTGGTGVEEFAILNCFVSPKTRS